MCFCNESNVDKVGALGFDAEKEKSWVTGSPESVYLRVFFKDHLQLRANTDTLVPAVGKMPTQCSLEMRDHHRVGAGQACEHLPLLALATRLG